MTEIQQARLLEMLCGDREAFDFLINFDFVSEIFDDLHDQDKPVDKATLTDALMTVIQLPKNPFYLANLPQLQALMEGAFLHWLASNDQSIDVEKRHFFRYLGVQVWVQCVAIKQGLEAASQLVGEIWSFTTMEKLEKFKSEGL